MKASMKPTMKIRSSSLGSTIEIENRLKVLWREYIERQDKHGADERTMALKKEYLDLYQRFRRDKKWKELISNNY